jgi:hypothetical protein
MAAYRLKYDIPGYGDAGDILKTADNGYVAGYQGSQCDPELFEDIFEQVPVKRVLIVEYKIVGDNIGLDNSGLVVSETGASRYLNNYPNNCRIEERY